MLYGTVTRLMAVCIFLLNLAACGFSPVYNEGSPSADKLFDIQVAPPNTHPEYLLVQNIEERLGHNPDASMLLKHDLWIYEQGLDVFAARVHVVGKIGYTLVSQSDGNVVASGVVESFTAYSPVNKLVESARRDATERLIRILSEMLIVNLTAKLAQQ